VAHEPDPRTRHRNDVLDGERELFARLEHAHQTNREIWPGRGCRSFEELRPTRSSRTPHRQVLQPVLRVYNRPDRVQADVAAGLATNSSQSLRQENMMVQTASTMLPLGTPCPDFALPNVVDGKTVSRDDFAGKPLLVMFICNHCPF